MDSVETKLDVEATEPGFDDMRASPSRGVAFVEAAALLTIWSLLVINEGSIRFNDTIPSVGLGDAGRPSKLILFVAALGEVIFGLLGFFVGFSALVLRWYNDMAVKATMVLQTLLGYYVFVVYVFVVPIFNAVDLTEERIMVDGLSLSQSRAVIIMGLLTSFHFCLALQGGQFVFMARLIASGSGTNFLMQKTGTRMRAMFWNLNLSFAGLWTLITGAIIIANSTVDGKLQGPFVSPPNVGRLPGLTLWTGLVMIIWGIVGFAFALTRTRPSWMYYTGTAYVYVSAFLNYGIVQFGMFTRGLLVNGEPRPSPSGAVALHNGLVFMVVFLGPYFVHLSSSGRDGKEEN